MRLVLPIAYARNFMDEFQVNTRSQLLTATLILLAYTRVVRGVLSYLQTLSQRKFDPACPAQLN